VAERRFPQRPVQLLAERPGLCWIAAIGCLIGATAVLHPGGLFNIIISLRTKQPYARTLGGIALTAGLSFFLVVPAVFGERLGGVPRRILAWRPLAFLGLVSYGVYLYHLVVGELIGEASDPSHFSARGWGLAVHLHHLSTVVLFVLTLAGSTALAAISYRVIELPFLRLKET
jgi:peptidoglycan/LPS O-acetylase OafA/YrhL